MLVLAVKPDMIPPVLSEIEPHLSKDTVVVSIAAGVTLGTIEKARCGKRVCIGEGGDGGRGMGLEGSFVARVSHLTIDHAPLRDGASSLLLL